MFLRRNDRTTDSDEELVARIASGDRSGLGILWDRYAHLLFGVAMKYLKDPEASKDAVMEVFSRIPRALVTQRIDRFRPWVHVVIRNQCIELLRRSVPNGELPDAADPHDIGDDALLLDSELDRLESAIEGLGREQSTCIRMFHFERLTYQEIATRIGATTQEVRSHLQNGRRNLRIILSRHGAHRE